MNGKVYFSMIKSIAIKNFQSHINSTITFTNGFNIITGSSDSGKSAILRALLWLANNRPSGNSITNWSASEKDTASVKIELPDCYLVKTRQQNKNNYFIEKNKETTSFSAIKQDVPEEISSKLNFTEFNIQTQHQPYFLLNDTPGEVARKLNELVGLNVIDTLFKNLNSEVVKTNRKINSYTTEIEGLKNEIERLSFVDVLSKELIRLEIKVKRWTESKAEITDIKNFLNSFIDINNKLNNAKQVTKYENQVNEIQNHIVDVDNIKCAIKELTTSIIILSKNTKKIVEYNLILNQENKVKYLQKIFKEFQEQEDQLYDLQDTIENFSNKQKNLIQEVKIIFNLTEEYNILLKEAKICPLCGAKTS